MENRAVYCMNLKDNRDGSTATSSKEKFDFCIQRQIVGIGWASNEEALESDPAFSKAKEYMSALKTGDLVWIKAPNDLYYIAEILDDVLYTPTVDSFASHDLSCYRNCIFHLVGSKDDIPAEYTDYLIRLVTPQTIQPRTDVELIDAVNNLWVRAKNIDEAPAKDTTKIYKKAVIITICVIVAIIALFAVRGVVHNIQTSKIEQKISEIEQEMNEKLEGKTFANYNPDTAHVSVAIINSDGLFDSKEYEINKDKDYRWELSGDRNEQKLKYSFSDEGELTDINNWGLLQLDSNGNPEKIGDNWKLANEKQFSMMKKADELELTKHKLSDFIMTIDEYREAYKSSGLPVKITTNDSPEEGVSVLYKSDDFAFGAVDDRVKNNHNTFRLYSISTNGDDDEYMFRHIMLCLKSIPGAITDVNEIEKHWEEATPKTNDYSGNNYKGSSATKEFTINGITYGKTKTIAAGKLNNKAYLTTTTDIEVSVNLDHVVYLADYPEFDGKQATNDLSEDYQNNGGISTGGDASTEQAPTSENTNNKQNEVSDGNNAYNKPTPNGNSDGAGNSNSNNISYNSCANGHTWSEAMCESPATCSVCGQVSGVANGHTWSDATCTEPATCTTCHETSGSAKGHSWNEATCSTPKQCQVCKTTEGSALPHNMYYTRCTMCDHTDFSNYTLDSNTFCGDSWFYLGGGSQSQYLEDGEASISIDKNGVCTVNFDKYSYTFTLVQTMYDVYGLHFECYMNGEPVKNTEVSFYFSQNRCEFFTHGGTLGFSQVALNFDM